MKETKANVDGWVTHHGVNCPVDGGTVVDIRCRNGSVYEGGMASCFIWKHSNNVGDVTAYRIHAPAEQPEPVISELLYDPVAQGPLQWRNRIRELDTKRAEVESDYQRQISEITQERESLVQKLAGEGLALVGDKPGALLNWQRYAKDGMKINAIKEYRELTGAGLREAKETVEAYQDSIGWVQPAR
jgi:hypothetical protein